MFPKNTLTYLLILILFFSSIPVPTSICSIISCQVVLRHAITLALFAYYPPIYLRKNKQGWFEFSHVKESEQNVSKNRPSNPQSIISQPGRNYLGNSWKIWILKHFQTNQHCQWRRASLFHQDWDRREKRYHVHR